MSLHLPKNITKTVLLSSGAVPFDPVHAAPAVAWIAGTLMVSTAAATIILQIAISFALSALSILLMKKPDTSGGGLQTSQTTSGETIGQKIMCGYWATGGNLVAPAYTHGDDNDYLNMIYAVSDVPITAFIDKMDVGGREQTIVDADEDATYGKTVSGKLNKYFWLRTHDGTQTTADSMLVSKYAEHPERPWADTAVLTGVAYAVATMKYNTDRYSGVPQVLFSIKGAKFYDPRKDSTVGGSGSQRYSNQSTWQFTANPVVIVYNILRGIPIGGGIYGLNVKEDAFDYPRLFAAMNVCDEPGTKPTSTDWRDDIRRYSCGYEIDVSKQPLDAIDEIMKACGGAIAFDACEYHFLVGPPNAPIASITDDDIILDTPIDSQSFLPMAENYNTVRATYPNPRKLWNVVEAPVYSKPEWVVEDGGLELVADVQFNSVFVPTQVRRLMREVANDHRRRRVHTITLGPKFSFLKVFDVINWTSPHRFYTSKKFMIHSISIDSATLAVTLEIRERDPADYDLDALDVHEPTYPSVETVLPTVVGVRGFAVSAVNLKDNLGIARKPAIKMVWNSANLWTKLAYQIREKFSGDLVKSSTLATTRDGEYIYTTGLLPNTEYEVRMKVVAARYDCEWSDWKTVKTNNVKITSELIDTAVFDQVATIATENGLRVVDISTATGRKVGEIVSTSDGKLYRWTGSAWTQDVVATVGAGSLTADRFAESIEGVGLWSGGSLPATKVTGHSLLMWGGVLYRWTGTEYARWTSATDIVGQLVAGQISAGAVGAVQLASESVTAQHLLVASTSNVIPNGDCGEYYAVASTYWNVVGSTGTVDYVSDTASIGTGLYSIRLKKTTLTNSIYATHKQYIPVKAGDQYYVAAAIKGDVAATAGAYLRVLWYDKDKVALTTTVYNDAISNSAITTSWVTKYSNITVPAGAKFCRIQIYNHSTNTTCGTLLFDYVQMRKRGVGELIVDGEVRAIHLAANSVTTDKLVAASVTAEKCASNLIVANSALIAEAAIGDAMIGNLSANKLIAGTTITGGVLVSGTPLTTVASNAANPAAVVNTGSTKILPGSISISGSTTLADWRDADDQTLINGGNIQAQTVEADAVLIGADSDNLIPNGLHSVFGSVPSRYWVSGTSGTTATVVYGTTQSTTGLYSLVLTKATLTGAVFVTSKQYIPVRAGDELYSEVKYKTTSAISAGSGFYMRIYFYDKDEVALSPAYVNLCNNTSISSSWQVLNSSVVVPDGAAYCRIRFDNYTGNTVAADLIIDYATLKRKASGSMIIDGTLEASKIIIGDMTNIAPNGWHVTTGAVASQYWKLSSGVGNVYYIAGNSTNGLYSLSIAKASLNSQVQIESRSFLPVKWGDQYYVETAIRGNVAATAGGYVIIKYYDKDKVFLTNTYPVSNKPLTTSYVTYSGTSTVPSPAAVYMKVFLFNATSNTTATTTEYDYLTIRKKTGGSLIVDGDIEAKHLNTTSFSASGLAVFGGDIKSDDYVAGSTGWKISGTGSAEFNGPVISRQISAATSKVFYAQDYGSLAAANAGWAVGTYLEFGPFNTGITADTWTFDKVSYTCTAGLEADGEGYISGSTGAAWDWEATLLNRSTLAGSNKLYIRVRLYRVNSAMWGFAGNIRWRVFKVT